MNRLRHTCAAWALLWAMPGCRAELAVSVNIPSGTMTVVQDGRQVAAFPVRTGRRDLPTPSGQGSRTVDLRGKGLQWGPGAGAPGADRGSAK